MENVEGWNAFLGKEIRAIIEDKPSPIPKHKDGLLEGITTTHLILNRNGKTEALRLSDIRRVELRRL